jgi:hypothetical protein
MYKMHDKRRNAYTQNTHTQRSAKQERTEYLGGSKQANWKKKIFCVVRKKVWRAAEAALCIFTQNLHVYKPNSIMQSTQANFAFI